MVLSGVAATLAAFLLLPLISDAVSAAKLMLRQARAPEAAGAHPRLLFIVPAHDEAGMIEQCVSSLVAQTYATGRFDVVVVADNCTDATAAIAASAGARCLVREDPHLPGKPHAIAYALQVLPVQQYDAVIIIDADAVVDSGFAEGVACVPDLRNCAAQAYNGVRNPQQNALTRLALLFGVVRYEFAFPLKEAAGINVPMQGNGMCLGTDLLARHPWQAFSICEDWELYAQLTAAGHVTRFAPHARVHAHEAATLKESSSQRKRWSGGKITVFLQMAPRLILSRRVGWHQKVDIIGELFAVGPAVHIGLVSVVSGMLLLSHAPGAALVSAGLALSLGRTTVYSLCGLRRVSHPVLTLMNFAYLPFYIVWRLGLQAGALLMVGNRPWVRTGRPV